MNGTTLEKLRREIDSIDNDILVLLGKRMQVARRIGYAKGNAPVYDPEREKTVIRRLRTAAPYIDGSSLTNVYNAIMALCRSVQKKEELP